MIFVGKTVSLIGKRSERLVVTSYSHKDEKYKQRYWNCVCDCGNTIKVNTSDFNKGSTRSCGCLKKESLSKNGKKGMVDLTGQKINRWFVKGKDEIKSKNNRVYWNCVCDCGKEKSILAYNLKKGLSKSCGCIRDEVAKLTQLKAAKSNITHGYSHTALYKKYRSMMERCYREKNENYINYGGRGINVCTEWRTFEGFLKWSLDNGYQSGLSIERIDVNKDYCPENCKWITIKEQQSNKTTSRKLTYGGITMTTAEWSRETGIKAVTIRARLNRGWSVEKTLTTYC